MIKMHKKLYAPVHKLCSLTKQLGPSYEGRKNTRLYLYQFYENY